MKIQILAKKNIRNSIFPELIAIKLEQFTQNKQFCWKFRKSIKNNIFDV